MRDNFGGLMGYAVLVLGFTIGGLAIVSGGSGHWGWTAISAPVAIVLLVVASVTLVSISKREHHDPLEPMMTRDGVRRYVRRREEGVV